MADTGYSKYVAITKSDTVDFDGGDSTKAVRGEGLCDAIYAVAGTVIAIDQAGNSTTFTISAGTQAIIPIRARRVGASSSATSMIALYR
jgi:hypothetical protein